MRAGAKPRGAALVELAVILPLFLVVLVGATDFGRMAYLSVLVSNAASAAVRYAAQSSDMAGNLDAIRAAALRDMGQHGAGRDFTANAERYCTCAPSDAATACDSLCPLVAGYPTQPRMFVRVNVQATLDMLFQYPGIPKTMTIARQAQARTQ
jgi:hypothetical protein